MLLSKYPEDIYEVANVFQICQGMLCNSLNKNKLIDFSLMGVGTNVLG